MATVYDSAGQAIDVPDETAVRLVQGGGYTMGAGTTARAADRFGAPVEAGEADIGTERDLTGYATAGTDLRQQRLEAEHDTVGSRLRAFGGGASDALSLGFVSPWKDDREFHPNYGTAGEVGGIAASLFIPGAGEENLARGAAEGTQALREAGLLGKVARGTGEVLERTPLGLANRLGEAAGGLVRGEGTVARIGRSATSAAVGGGAIGLGTEISHQLLDSDAPFSGENLLGATLRGAALGGALGAGGGLLSEGIGAVSSRLSRGEEAGSALSRETALARTEGRAPELHVDVPGVERPPLAPMLDPKNVTLIDGVTSRATDLESLSTKIQELSDSSPALLRQAGLTREYLSEAQGTISRELNGLRSLSHFEDAPLARLAEDAHANDLVGQRLATATEDVPARWSDQARVTEDLLRRDRALDELAKKRASGMPVSKAEEDAVRLSSQLSSGASPDAAEAVRGSLLANLGRQLAARVPGGRLIASGLGAAGGVGLAEHVISHGVGSLLGHALLPVGAGLVAAKAVQAAFRDPLVGGLIAADATHVLDSTGVLADGHRTTSTSPQRALRDLGDRVRSVTPQQVYQSTVASLGHVGASSPAALAQAGQAAMNRHAQLVALLDRVDPRATTAGQSLLGRPLPSARAAQQVADFVRVAASPTNFIVAASQGRLTQSMMAQAEATWPATVARFRQQLALELSRTGGEGLGPEQRRTVSIVLGPTAGTRSASYATAMRGSQSRISTPNAPTGQRPPAPVPTQPPAPTPAMRAANPGGYR